MQTTINDKMSEPVKFIRLTGEETKKWIDESGEQKRRNYCVKI